MYSFAVLLVLQLVLLSGEPIADRLTPNSDLDENFNHNNHLDSSHFNLNHHFVLNHQRASDRSPHQETSPASASLRYSSAFHAVLLSSTGSSFVTNSSERLETINLKPFDESIADFAGFLEGRLSGHIAAAGDKEARVSERSAGSTVLHKDNESRVYDFSFDRKSVDNSFSDSLASAVDGGSIRLGEAESAEHRLGQLKQSDELDHPDRRLTDQLNQLNIIQQLDDADQLNKLSHLNDPHHSSNHNKPENNRNKFNSGDEARSRQSAGHNLKHGKLKRMSRSRRSSVHNASNVSSEKKLERKDKLLPFLIPHRLQAELIAKNELQNLKILSHLNISTMHYLTDNSTDYNSTNAAAYVELPPSLKVFFYCVYTLIFFVGLIGNSLVGV